MRARGTRSFLLRMARVDIHTRIITFPFCAKGATVHHEYLLCQNDKDDVLSTAHFCQRLDTSDRQGTGVDQYGCAALRHHKHEIDS